MIVIVILALLIIALVGFRCYKSHKEIRDSEKALEDYQKEIIHRIEICNNVITNIKLVEVNDFSNLLKYHQYAWNNGIQPKTLACNINKYFRRSIPNLTLDDIYLGNIDYLTMQSVPEWLEDNEPIGSNPCGRNPNWSRCNLVWYQYKNIILGSIGSYLQALKTELAKSYENSCQGI